MLELMIAGSMMAMIMTSLSVVMRSSRVAWDANESDYAKLHQGHSVVRHFVRAAREAKAVETIGTDTSISLGFSDGTSKEWIWKPDGTSSGNGFVYLFDTVVGTPTELAFDILQLRFAGYKADGITPTTTPSEIRLVEVTAVVELPRDHESRRSITSKVWIRSW